jgi:hypothetical protein
MQRAVSVRRIGPKATPHRTAELRRTGRPSLRPGGGVLCSSLHRYTHCISRPAGSVDPCIRSLSHLRFLFPSFAACAFSAAFSVGPSPTCTPSAACRGQARQGIMVASATWTLPPPGPWTQPGWAGGRTPSMHTPPSLLGRMHAACIHSIGSVCL